MPTWPVPMRASAHGLLGMDVSVNFGSATLFFHFSRQQTPTQHPTFWFHHDMNERHLKERLTNMVTS